MNKFVNAIENDSTVTVTENGDKTYSSSLNKCVDLFFKIGAVRHDQEKLISLFSSAYEENPDIALKIALWARDIRGGAGERQAFRTILNYLSEYGQNHAKHLIAVTPIFGRWDDLLAIQNPKLRTMALDMWADNIFHGDGLASKWAPREKSAQKAAAQELREIMGLSARDYRKFIAQTSNTVETRMCGKDWESIDFSHVPSVAMSRYSKAFKKHLPEQFDNYLSAVQKGEEKINTSAVYPYDVVKDSVDDKTADTLWKNLPDWIESSASFLPIIDTSGSMLTQISGSVTCRDIAISLGMYMAERNRSAFKDLFISFSAHPRFHKISGHTIRDRYHSIREKGDWDMNTNLDAAFNLILETAKKHNVHQHDLPGTLIVLSDMEFDSYWGNQSNTSVSERTKALFKNAGYKLPNIVWWNIQSRGDTVPVRFDESGMALVSGYSPTLMKNVLGDNIDPMSIMLSTVDVDRYSYEFSQ